MRLDHRNSERTSRNNRVTIVITSQDGEIPVPAKLIDVSSGGLGFQTPTLLEKGQRLRIRVEVETTLIVSQRLLFVQGAAAVKRIEPTGKDNLYLVGAAWDKLEAGEREKWKGFLGKTRSMMF